jgi:hypothetical protein
MVAKKTARPSISHVARKVGTALVEEGGRRLVNYGHQKITEYLKPKPSKPTKKPTHKPTKKPDNLKYVADDIHSGVTHFKLGCVIHEKPPKAMKGAPVTYYETSQVECFGKAGQQGVTTVSAFSTSDQWINSTATSSLSINQTRTGYFSLNPSQAVPASTLYGPAKLQPAMDRWAMQYHEQFLQIANFSTVATECDLIILKSKKWHNYEPLALWQSGLNVEADTLGAHGSNAGGTTTTTTTGALLVNDLYMTMRPKIFRDFWEIKKEHRMMLAPAACESVVVSFKVNTLGKFDTFVNQNVSNLYMPGTVVVVLIQKGMPVRDNTVPATPIVTTGSTSIGVTIAKKSVFKPIMMNAARIRVQVGNVGLTTGIPATAQLQVNILDSFAAVQALG